MGQLPIRGDSRLALAKSRGNLGKIVQFEAQFEASSMLRSICHRFCIDFASILYRFGRVGASLAPYGELPHGGGPGGQSVGRQLLEVSTLQFWIKLLAIGAPRASQARSGHPISGPDARALGLVLD